MVTHDVDEALRRAITGKRLVRFRFHGCLRVAEPHDYGVRNGAVQLLVYQVGGESRSGKLPNWRWIIVSEMSALEVLEQTFAGGRDVPSGGHAKWDELYLRVAGRGRV
jgi:hypothetical protein